MKNISETLSGGIGIDSDLLVFESAKQPIDEFTFTMKESAKTHTKEVKKLLEQLKEYFEIPSNLEQFFNEVVA